MSDFKLAYTDESSFEYCFLGVHKKSIVSISTHGCITSRKQRALYKTGIEAMLQELDPTAILVHGYMPDDIFGEFRTQIPFYRYKSEFERTHRKGRCD